MNADRRKRLEKARGLIEEAKDIVAECASEERDYYDNMPEGLQASDKGEKADSDATALDECDSALDECINAINEAVEG